MSDQFTELKSALAGHYEIEREIGKGGMSNVYLARDERHSREVALKVLRPELAAIIGAERFVKEIEVTANLQHPNILPLYDSGEAGGFLYYVMPYLEGESLRIKLNREKQLSVEDTIEITEAVAAALEFAHQHDVIHRDIKPENILLQAGQALVADFGIALAVSQAGGTRLTETGLSLGTPHYMSPEQATGDREIDGRSDVYSLGVVVYEMLTGDPPHTGNTMQAIVAKVLTETPIPISRTRDMIPSNVDDAVQRALAKSPADRFASAANFAAALTDPSFRITKADAKSAGKTRKLWNPLSVGTTLVAVVLFIAVAFGMFRPSGDGQVMRFAIQLGDDAPLIYTGYFNPTRLALLPNGSGLVYVSGPPPDYSAKLLLRRFDSLEPQTVPGTANAQSPAVSPDSRMVAFLAVQGGHRSLKVVSVAGGSPISLVDSGTPGPPSWGSDGLIYFFHGDRRTLIRVSPDGDSPAEVVVRGPEGHAYHFPFIASDASAALVTAFPSDEVTPSRASIRVLDFASGSTRTLVSGVRAILSPTGHLLYVTAGALEMGVFDGTLMAVPFDPEALTLEGQPFAVFDGIEVRGTWGITDLTLSHSGLLAYATPGINTPEDVVWVTRDGRTEVVDPDWTRDVEFEGIALSPGGSQLAVEIVPPTADRVDIWIKQLDDGPLSRLTFDAVQNLNPEWSPDGAWIYYQSVRDGRPGLWRKRSNGTGQEERILLPDQDIVEARLSSNGDWMVIVVQNQSGDFDIMGMRAAADSVLVPLISEEASEFEPALSPNDAWLAYVSNESGQDEVYIRPFPNVNDGKWILSSGGGRDPLWSRDGRELFYRSNGGQTINVVSMTRGPGAATSRVLVDLPASSNYELNPSNRLFEVAADGRFLMLRRAAVPDVSGDLILVHNFFAELRGEIGE
ncbi:MAG: serine/threonine-protein kinase [Gemmatimonadetes bacterium]|nr:serine/threonine-protein kinase [Gemmatimonadota bacterium]